MDNLTHSLTGALIGQAGLKKKTGLGMAALVIGANIPDIDASCWFWMEGTESLAFRRGITHGPPAMLLLPVVLAAMLWTWDRWQASRGMRPEGRLPVRFGWLYLLSLIGCLSHPALDWMNTYGVRLLEPFSSRWFYGDTLFIIDLWLWLGLIAGTWLSWRREKNGKDGQRLARNVLGLCGLYIVANFAITQADKMLNTSFVETISSPQPIAFWQRESIGVGGEGSYFVRGEKLGNAPLSACDLEAARAADGQVDAFLFWSRAPVLDRMEDGTWMLGDARYYGAGRFNVPIPSEFCTEPASD